MSLGPIELVVIGFPGIPTSGAIADTIQDLVDNSVITLVDGLVVAKDDSGDVSIVEIEQVDASYSIKRLEAMLQDGDGLLSDEDAEEVAQQMAPGSSALMRIFENTWVKPFRSAVEEEGGVLLSQVRIPGPVVEEVMAAVAAIEDL